MYNKNEYFELVKQASANVSMYIKQWSERNNERWGEHEATWKALLFHELILIDERMKDSLSMENTPITKNKRTKGKKMDFWIGEYFIIEVKLVKYKKRDSGYGISNLNSKAGVYGDLLKLQAYLTSKAGSGIKGIVIAVHEVDNWKNKEDRDLDVSKIITKIDPQLVDLLSNNLQLLVCSDGECAYANADTS